jgi:Ca2+-transporting ATPase
LHVDESALTGESVPALKTATALAAGVDYPLADRLNMVYMGTLVTGGSGFAMVVATGRFTEIGRIQTLVGEAERPETPMEKQLDRMGTQLVLISGAVCGIVFVIGLLRGYGFLQMLKISISLAVAAVPEGLPTVATTTLALGIRNMRRRHVMIRRLEAVETLGSVQTICFDKTGTITLNRMTAVSVYAGHRRFRVSDGKFIAGEEPVNPYTCDELLRLLHVAALCSETEISVQEGEYILRGSPTENALIQMAISAGVDLVRLRKRHPILRMNHRSENRNFMSTLHVEQDSAGPSLLFAVKGSPTEVLAMCRWRVLDGNVVPLSEEDRLSLQIENEQMSGRALRVLATAYTRVAPEEAAVDLQDGLIWLGLIGMADPIRQGVKELIGDFHRAGIRTVMITGDQSPTAYAIGKELGLSGDEPLEILDSTHLTKIDPEVMTALSERVHIFARVSPAHKLQIVQAFQRGGKVVAMTGDGINDGPALKAADIGVAMGHAGTDVAREVADLILENDGLDTMIVAVSHGRTIYNNIRKSVHFLLATNLSEIMVMFVAIAGGLGQPLNSMQLLWINLVSDIFPGLALALEPPEPDVLSRPPRDPEEPIIKRSDFKRIGFEAAMLSAGSLAAYGYGIVRYGAGPRAGTLAFMSLTCGQLLHAVSCRSERHSLFDTVADRDRALPPNRPLQAALGGSFALQALALTVPGLRSLLGIAPIGLLDGVVIGSTALLPLAVNEATKRSLSFNPPSSRNEVGPAPDPRPPGDHP